MCYLLVILSDYWSKRCGLSYLTETWSWSLLRLFCPDFMSQLSLQMKGGSDGEDLWGSGDGKVFNSPSIPLVHPSLHPSSSSSSCDYCHLVTTPHRCHTGGGSCCDLSVTLLLNQCFSYKMASGDQTVYECAGVCLEAVGSVFPSLDRWRVFSWARGNLKTSKCFRLPLSAKSFLSF